MATCQVFDSLGFTVHSVKSVLQPTQRIEFLEFWLDLVNMIVSLTDRKVEKIRSVCDHIPGSTYIEAEFESRVDRHEIEWRLDERFFLSIVRKLGGCDVDLFASRVNAQLKSYVSWRPDPDAMAVDVFTLDWSKFRAFCFPPFSLISRVLQTLDLSGRVCDCGAF